MVDIEAFKNASGEVRGQSYKSIIAQKIEGPEDVTFIECDFSGADFSESDLSGLTFRDCTFQKTIFRGTKLHFATFCNPKDFTGSVFEGCTADGITFSNCDLTDINARHSRLQDATFNSTKLTRTNFEGSDLLGYNGLESDDTIIRNAALIPSASGRLFSMKGFLQAIFGIHIEPWRYLRIKFTGLNLFLSTLPALIIVISLLVKLMFGIAATVMAHEDSAAFLKSCISAEAKCQTQPIWWVLAGFGESIFAAIFVLFSVVHNGIRFLVTKQVDYLSRQESINGRTPFKANWIKLRYAAYVLTITQLLMLILFGINFYNFLVSEVPAPN